jgi:LysM repeat protein
LSFRSASILLAATLLLSAPRAGHAHRYTHEVLPGETLTSIAKRYHTTPRKLRRLNRIRRKHLRAGEKLKIVTSAPCRPLYKARYKVRRGDSLARIAKRHKMKRSLLRRLNRKINFKRLREGQTLWVVIEGPRPKGGVRGLYRLTDGPGYLVRSRARAWGTFLTITRLMEVLADHSRRYPKAPLVRVDDISKRGGGYLPPHASHRRGRDVDIRYPLKIRTDMYVPARASTLDLERTWDLLQRFIETEDVVYIFVDHRFQKLLYQHVKKRYSKKRLRDLFQYPRSPRSMSGIIRHEPGHASHFHVRFRKEKAPAPPVM